MGIGNHGQRELRLGAEGVEAGRVEDDQSALQQRVRIIDQGMAPGGDFHRAVGMHHVPQVGVVVVPQTQGARVVHRDVLLFRDGAHGRHHFIMGIEVELEFAPFDRHALERRHTFVAVARFDGKKTDVGLLAVLEEDLGGAHGGAPDIRRQQSLLEIGEKQRVDELGLATRKLGHEGQDQAVLLEAFDQVENA